MSKQPQQAQQQKQRSAPSSPPSPPSSSRPVSSPPPSAAIAIPSSSILAAASRNSTIETPPFATAATAAATTGAAASVSDNAQHFHSLVSGESPPVLRLDMHTPPTAQQLARRDTQQQQQQSNLPSLPSSLPKSTVTLDSAPPPFSRRSSDTSSLSSFRPSARGTSSTSAAIVSSSPYGSASAAAPPPTRRTMSHFGGGNSEADTASMLAFQPTPTSSTPLRKPLFIPTVTEDEESSSSSSSGSDGSDEDEEDSILARWSNAVMEGHASVSNSPRAAAAAAAAIDHSAPQLGSGLDLGDLEEGTVPLMHRVMDFSLPTQQSELEANGNEEGSLDRRGSLSSLIIPTSSSLRQKLLPPSPLMRRATARYKQSLAADPATSGGIPDLSKKRKLTMRSLLPMLLRRIPYYVPVLSWSREYKRGNLLGDILAGLTVGVMLVPQCITYAGLAGLPPIHGLYAAFFPLVVYAIMGSSKHLSIGPEITSSILLGKVISGLPNIQKLKPDDPGFQEEMIGAAMALTLCIGLVALVLGFFRLGFLDSILSRPILAGFVMAVGLVLICQQLPVLFGFTACDKKHCGENCEMDECGADANSLTILIYTFNFMMARRRWSSSTVLMCIPDVLLVVVGATAISYALDLESHGVITLGKMDPGFKTPTLPKLRGDNIGALLSGATVITILGFVESQLSSKKFANKHAYPVSANRELVALGMCSFIGSFFGAYSAFGSIPRTKVSEMAGAKTQIAVLVASFVPLVSIVVLLPLFQHMPKAVSASIIFVVAFSLIEIHEVQFIIRVRQWFDLFLLVAMLLIAFFLGIDTGVFFAFGVCLLLTVKQTTLPQVTMIGRGYADDDFHDLEEMDEEVHSIEGMLIYKVDGPLYFANAEKLKDSCRRVENYGGFHVHPSEPPKPVSLTSIVFDMTALTSVDASALSIFLELVTHYRVARGISLYLVKVRRPIRKLFDAAGITALIGREHYTRTLEAAVAKVQTDNVGNLQHCSPALMSTVPGTPQQGALRRKKSSFFGPPVVASPLLRGMSRISM